MNAPLSSDAADQLDLVFGALADRTRRGILGRLADGERSVTELVAGFDLSQPAVSKHLKVLEGAGLVSRARSGQFRPCRINPDGLATAATWLGAYRQFWEDSLDQLEVYVKELQRQEQLHRTTATTTSSRTKSPTNTTKAPTNTTTSPTNTAKSPTNTANTPPNPRRIPAPTPSKKDKP